ncbi:glutathione S-transferase U9-like [Neltuma alba]|uniref:glutathione S-transferase U9-like n=1 Tax=Neltuma alba TaxID=207710 RepID=UPI0010A46175|nr:glutathione S-transferase U9-like [Prosopis alba]XP_028763448.1 glutathione S-transferase U9-like [Prosopis alba]
MENQKVILHGMWISPYVKRVELALKLKNIPFDYVEEDLSNKSELLLRYNPVYKKVPVLVHNGNPICESYVILEYIDETWKHGPRLMPEDPYRRAQVRFWSKFIQDQLFGAYVSVVKTEGEAQQKAMKEMEEKLGLLENGMKKYFPSGKPEVNENNAGVLDIMFCSLLGPYKSQEEALGVKLLDADKFPVLFSWLMALVQLQVVKEATPPHEKVVQFLQFVRHSALRSTTSAS